MEQRIDFEKLQGIVEYLISNPNSNYDTILSLLQNFDFDEASAKYWLDTFIAVMGSFLVTELDLSNCIEWILKQVSLGRTTEQITEFIISMFCSVIEDTNVIVYRDNEIYKEMINKSKKFELLSRLNDIQEEVNNIDDSDEALLSWAKENCDFYIYKQSLLDKIEEIKLELQQMGVEV